MVCYGATCMSMKMCPQNIERNNTWIVIPPLSDESSGLGKSRL